jgi:acetoacetyl-CoA synthetase
MPHIDETITPEAKELWRPSSPEKTQIYDFMTKVNKKHGLSLNDYDALWKWSVSEPAQFWEEIWHYTHIKAHEPYKNVSIIEPTAQLISRNSY